MPGARITTEWRVLRISFPQRRTWSRVPIVSIGDPKRAPLLRGTIFPAASIWLMATVSLVCPCRANQELDRLHCSFVHASLADRAIWTSYRRNVCRRLPLLNEASYGRCQSVDRSHSVVQVYVCSVSRSLYSFPPPVSAPRRRRERADRERPRGCRGFAELLVDRAMCVSGICSSCGL